MRMVPPAHDRMGELVWWRKRIELHEEGKMFAEKLYEVEEKGRPKSVYEASVFYVYITLCTLQDYFAVEIIFLLLLNVRFIFMYLCHAKGALKLVRVKWNKNRMAFTNIFCDKRPGRVHNEAAFLYVTYICTFILSISFFPTPRAHKSIFLSPFVNSFYSIVGVDAIQICECFFKYDLYLSSN